MSAFRGITDMTRTCLFFTPILRSCGLELRAKPGSPQALAIHTSLRPNVSDQVCPYCNRPLMKIDQYGEMLVGCIDCNRWGLPGDDKLIMELLESDLESESEPTAM